MSKRFTATEKWTDPWFCSLTEREKLFWIYLLDNCDHAGIWRVNKPLVEFYFPNIDFDGFKSKTNGRIKVISDEKWFLPKFIEFQYGNLSESNRMHLSVISVLRKEGAYKALESPIQGAKEQEQEQDKDKDKDKDKDLFYLFWEKYPKKKAKQDALKAYQKIHPDEAFLKQILMALEKHKKQEDWIKEGGKYIPLPASWLNGKRWEDEIKTKTDTNREYAILDKVFDKERIGVRSENEMGPVSSLFRGMDKVKTL